MVTISQSVREERDLIIEQIKLGTAYRQRITTAATFLRSCIAQALKCGDGPRHPLLAPVQYCEYNKDLIFLSTEKDLVVLRQIRCNLIAFFQLPLRFDSTYHAGASCHFLKTFWNEILSANCKTDSSKLFGRAGNHNLNMTHTN